MNHLNVGSQQMGSMRNIELHSGLSDESNVCDATTDCYRQINCVAISMRMPMLMSMFTMTIIFNVKKQSRTKFTIKLKRLLDCLRITLTAQRTSIEKKVLLLVELVNHKFVAIQHFIVES